VSLRGAVTDIQKQMKVTGVGEAKAYDVISSGSAVIDIISGINGFPKGRIVEIAGEYGCGKTTLSMQTAVNCQRNGGKVLVVDVENSWDLMYAKTLGLKVDFKTTEDRTFYFYQEVAIEDVFYIVHKLISSGELDLVIIDSIAGMLPKVQLSEVLEDDKSIGLKSRIMTPHFARLAEEANKAHTCVLAVNQLRNKFDFKGYGGGVSLDTPGGNSLKYFKSMSLWLMMGKMIRVDSDSELAGEVKEIEAYVVHAEFKKNKCGPPYRKADMVIRPGKGTDNVITAIELAITKGIITGSRAYRDHEGNPIGGKIILLEYYMTDPQKQAGLYAALGWEPEPYLKNFTSAGVVEDSVTGLVIGEIVEGSPSKMEDDVLNASEGSGDIQDTVDLDTEDKDIIDEDALA